MSIFTFRAFDGYNATILAYGQVVLINIQFFIFCIEFVG